MAEVFRTDVVFSTTDELSIKLREIVNALRGADRSAKQFQQTLNEFKIGRIGLPNISVFREQGMAAGRAFSEGFAQAAGQGVREAAKNVAQGAAAAATGGASVGRASGGAVALLGGSGGPRSPFSPMAISGGSGSGGGGMVPFSGGGGSSGGGGGNALARGGIPLNYRAPVFGGGGAGGGGGGRGGGGFGMGSPFGMMAGGMILGQAGSALGGANANIAEAGMEYTSAIANLRAQGLTAAEMATATKKAWETAAAVPTSGATENIKTLGELRYALGTASHAEDALVGVQKMTGVLGAFSHGSMGKDSAYNAARALEMSGRANNQETFSNNLEMMTKAIVASGGKVTAEHFLGFSQQGGSQYTPGLSDEFRYNVQPRIMQEMGGMRAGTGFAALSRQLIGGIASDRTFEAMRQGGLITGGQAAFVGKGVQKHLAPGSIIDQELFSADPYEWMQKYVAPKLVGKTTTQQSERIARMFATGPAQREAAIMLLQGRVLGGGANSPIERDRAVSKTVQNGTYETLLNSSPDVVMKAFTTTWHTFVTALGDTVVPIIVPALKSMTTVLQQMTGWAREHPEAVQQMLRISSALAAMLTTVGTLAVGIGAAAAIFALGTPVGALVLFTGALAGLTAYFATDASGKNIQSLSTALTSMGFNANAVLAAFSQFGDGVGRVKDALTAILDAVTTFGHDMRALASTLTFGLIKPLPGATDGAPPTVPAAPTTRELLERNHGAGLVKPTGYAPRGAGGNVHIVNNIVLDGRQIAHNTMRRMADDLEQPLSGGGRFDGRMSPMMPGTRST